MYTVSGASGTNICTQALKYDPPTNNWSVLAHGLKPTVQATASYIPSTGKIYVIGGITSLINYTYFDKVEAIDTRTGAVESIDIKNPMPTAYGGAAVWNDKIYLFGGSTNLSGSTRAMAEQCFYEFDPVLSKFTRLPDMPQKLQAAGAIVDGILYTFGGFDPQSGRASKNIYAYSIQAGSWKLIGQLPEAVSANTVAVCGKFIFTAGGYDNPDFIGFLNTQTQKFTKLKSNLTGRKHAGAVALYDHLVVIGGSTSIRNLGFNNVQVADLKELEKLEQ